MTAPATPPIVTISASWPRRIFALAAMLGLGGLLIVLALSAPQAGGLWRAGLGLGGLASLALGEALRRSSGLALELRACGLFDSAGRQLAALEEIDGVERGTFALKPSNGFTLRLRAPATRLWAPGLYWRLGRRLGVGGITAAAPTRAMAEALELLLVERAVGKG